MATSPLTLAFVMDPIESIDIRADTTFVLMLEAQRRGHRVLYVEPGGVGVDGGLHIGGEKNFRELSISFLPKPNDFIVFRFASDGIHQTILIQIKGSHMGDPRNAFRLFADSLSGVAVEIDLCPGYGRGWRIKYNFRNRTAWLKHGEQ